MKLKLHFMSDGSPEAELYLSSVVHVCIIVFGLPT